jgi:pSer/pThr/pTyr-binding forkhead associated (FHA) protein
MATLYQINNDGYSLERWDIDEESIVVGRSGQAEVSVADDGLSRRHFLIVRDGEGYVLKDLSSRNGTWLDGHRVFAEKLHHHDRILAGNTLFLFADPSAVPATIRGRRKGPHGTVMLSPLKSALA